MRMARHFWPRFMLFLLIQLILTPLFLFAYGFSLSGLIPVTLSVFVALIAFALFSFGNLYAWSWILSGWLRHELVPDDMSHPLSTGKHTLALCWHQFFSILVAGLIFLIVIIPFVVLDMALLQTFTELIVIYDIGSFGITVGHLINLILLYCIPLFVGSIFYFRYSVGALSLTLYGQKMSLSDASDYSTEHGPAGLTRRYAIYMVCYVFVMSLVGMALLAVAQSLSPHEDEYDIITLIATLLSLWLYIAGIATLISRYLKHMPTAALNPQKSQF